MHMDGPDGGCTFIGEFADKAQFVEHYDEHFEFFVRDIRKWFNTTHADAASWNSYDYDYIRVVGGGDATQQQLLQYPVVCATYVF